MGSEDNPLQALDPFLGARSAIGPEVVCPLRRDDSEVKAILILVRDVGGDGVSKVDLPVGEIEIGSIAVVS